MNKKVGNILKYCVSILVAAVLLYFAFRNIKWSDFWMALKACRWEYVVLSMLFGALAFYLRGLRWRELLRPIDRSTSRITCFNAINISYLVNLVLPRVGEVVRCGYITSHSRKVAGEDGQSRRLASFDKVLGTAALDRSADLVMMAVTLTTFLLFTWNRFGGFFSERIFSAASGRVTTGKVVLLAVLVAAAALAVWAVVHFADKWKPLKKVKDFCVGLWQGFISCMKMDRAWWFFLLTVLIWGCYLMMSATILWAVQSIDTSMVSPGLASSVEKIQDVGMVDALFLMLAGSLASIVPVPGGFGAFHFIVAGALSSVYVLPFEFGIIFATLSHESQTINQVIWGFVSYVLEHLRRKGDVS